MADIPEEAEKKYNNRRKKLDANQFLASMKSLIPVNIMQQRWEGLVCRPGTRNPGQRGTRGKAAGSCPKKYGPATSGNISEQKQLFLIARGISFLNNCRYRFDFRGKMQTFAAPSFFFIMRRVIRIKAMQALYSYFNNRSVNLEEARRSVFAGLIEMPEFYNAEPIEKEGFKALLPVLLDDAFAGISDEGSLQENQQWLAGIAASAVRSWHKENTQEKKRILEGIQSDINRQSEKEVFFWQLFLALTGQVDKEEENKLNAYLNSDASAPHTLKILQHPFLPALEGALFPNKGAVPTSFRSIDQEWVFRLYQVLFKDLPEYQTYRDSRDNSAEADIEIFKVLYRKLLRSEVFNEIMEEIDLRWSENRILLEVSLKETFRRLSAGEQPEFMRNEEENEEFARFFGILFESSLENRDEDEQRLAGVITNWNSDRVALLDKYLILLGINEMRNFPHIPVKVTINEYLEIAKAYSTPGSSSFINGVIDKMAKILQKEGGIKKSAKGLMDNR